MEKQKDPSERLHPKPEDIQELVLFLPQIYREGFQPLVKWEGGVLLKDGSYTFPYPVYQPEVLAFYKVAMKDIWMDHSYRPYEAWRMLADHQFVAKASIAEIKTMLTFCVRGERFGDGHWADMIEQGYIRRLLERLSTIQNPSNTTR